MDRRSFLALGISSIVAGCVSPAQIANYSEVIDNVWLAEIQNDAPDYHYKVITANPADVFIASKQAIIKLGIPVIREDMINGDLHASAIAPKPLTKAEWAQVVEKENSRVKSLSKGTMYLAKDPSEYFIDIEIKVRKLSEGETIININYGLRNPSYQAMGFYRLPRLAPPSAAIKGSEKFWKELRNILTQNYGYKSEIRKPKAEELFI